MYRHLATGDIWIEHFVSDDTDKAVGDVAGKCVQAIKKLASAVAKRPKEFGTNFALDAYAKQAKTSYYPGLSKNKEQQIAHHLCLVLDVSSGAL